MLFVYTCLQIAMADMSRDYFEEFNKKIVSYSHEAPWFLEPNFLQLVRPSLGVGGRGVTMLILITHNEASFNKMEPYPRLIVPDSWPWMKTFTLHRGLGGGKYIQKLSE